MMATQNPTIAPVKNVAACTGALERAIGRKKHLPGMVLFYGPAGFGKSVAACYAMGEYNAVYVLCKSGWTRKAALLAIARELGIEPLKTLYELTEQVSERLALSGRPLIVDEMDHLADRGIVEVIRDIYESSYAPILLIGEENLPAKLRKWERFHSRILHFEAAQPADRDDILLLARFYSPEIELSGDLITLLKDASQGSLRRVCVNLALIEETALSAGKTVVDLDAWKRWNKPLWTGQPEQRSKFF